ncbi:MAG: class I tRNA ligase family protein [Planctomycetota bacterium]
MWVKDADKPLTRSELKDKGLLLHAEQYKHPYPFCPRSDQDPLIQLARPAWYIRTTQRIQDAIQNNKQIQWFPETIRDGRFGNFLESNVDWALSRERFWGTPLNVWVNDETGALDMPTSVAEILERNPEAFAHWEAAKAADPSLPEHLRVHKPWIDQVSWTKPGEPGVYRRVPEVIDCWFDSGSMPFAQWGYPHQGQEQFQRCFPADFISEAIDQTRGWFYSLLMISTLLFEEQQQPHPYKTCVVLGHVCDREGKKESKSKGNYTPPEIILDCVRLQFAVKTDPGVPRGQVRINQDDYLGLDLEVNQEPALHVYRGDASAQGEPWVVRPDKKLERRIALLNPEDAQALELSPLAADASVMPKEVPSLPCERTVWLEDPNSKAPGADAFRWFFFASNPPWNQTRHSLSAVRTIQRELPLKLRNVYAFFTIYANIDGFRPEDATCKAGRRPAKARALLDRWALSELNLVVRRVTEHLDGYRLYEATQELTAFVDGLSNWYVRRSRDRFWAPGLEQDKLDAHWTLYECLVTTAQLLAPFLPFVTEEIWQNLVVGHLPDAPASVHMSDYPAADEQAVDQELSEVMNLVRDLVSLGLQVRTQNVLKVRQPLSKAQLVLTLPQLRTPVASHVALIADELNVQEVAFVEDASAFVTYEVKPLFPRLGPRVGKAMPALKKALAATDGGTILQALDTDGKYVVDAGGTPVELTPDDVQVSLTAKEGFAAASGKAGVVILTTTLTPELIQDGHFREVLHHVQTVRKDLDLEYTARIEVALSGAETPLAAVRGREATLAQEVLATEVRVGEPPQDGMHVHRCTVSGDDLVIGVKLAGS